MNLAVVIVTHDSRSDTLALLASMREDPGYANWEVVVVDNDSRDGTAQEVERRYPEVKVARNSPQHGFAAGVNQGMGLTSAPVVAIVNPDCQVPRGTLERLRLALMADDRIAAVGPLIKSPDGTVQRHGMFRPTPLTALAILLQLTWVPGLRRVVQRYYGDHLRDEPADVEHVTGALLTLRRAAFEDVGDFDERFFLYCEDVDWGLRAHDAGWRLVFVPKVEIVHQKSAAAKAKGAWAIRIYHRSMKVFYLKHSAGTPAPIRWVWLAGLRLQELSSLLRLRFRGEGIRY